MYGGSSNIGSYQCCGGCYNIQAVLEQRWVLVQLRIDIWIILNQPNYNQENGSVM
jgi:hypothetical protein